jgi:hypothetical protein
MRKREDAFLRTSNLAKQDFAIKMSHHIVFQSGAASCIFIGDRMTTPQLQSREHLIEKYPGVTFSNIGNQCWIDTTCVKIEAGAIIDLNSVLRIQGESCIYSGAVVKGGNITYSKIFGKVSGGNINHSTVGPESHVLQGTVNHSRIRGFVSGGTVNHSTVNGSVSDGIVNHSTINGTVSGGLYNHNTVNEQAWRQGSGRFSVIDGGVFRESVEGNTSDIIIKSPKPLTYKPSNVNREEKFDADPPDDLTDPVTYGLIHNAFFTPNGDTYDYDVIKQIITNDHRCPITRERLKISDLTPNRALQRKIEEWKELHRICSDNTREP